MNLRATLFLSFALLSACSSSIPVSARDGESIAAPSRASAPFPADAASAPVSSSHGDTLAKHEVPSSTTELSPSKSPPPHAQSSSFLALQELVQGNQRFVAGHATHPRQDHARRSSLVGGQQPKAIVLSCSDSRVPPELTFDQGLGEIFVVRTAGEVADSVALASIEYAVEHLHASLLIVMGHESCGAVKAALSTPPGASAGSAHLDQLVTSIRPNITGYTIASADKVLTQPVRANVEGVARGLLTRSTIIRHAVEHGELTIVRGLYHLDSGKVDIWF